MPVPFACPYCGLETLVDDDYAGETGPCASCGKDITVPHAAAGDAGSQAVRVQSKNARGMGGTIVLLSIAGMAALVLSITILIVVGLPAYRAAREMARQRVCEANLKQIFLELQSYEAEYHTLPPAFIPDANGRPMHSWRVLLLPQLGETGLYNQYNFNEPWDSPNNSQLALMMPAVYACPSDPDSRALGETNYMVIVGQSTCFPGANVMSSNRVSDDPATTLLLVETPVLGTSWMQPNDLSYDNMTFSINGGFGREPGSHHAEGANALMLDGSVRLLSNTTASDYVEGMATANGSEAIPPEALD